MHQQNFQIDSNAFEQFNHSYNVWVVIEEQIAMGLVRFACFASLVLWGLARAGSFRGSLPGFFFPLDLLSRLSRRFWSQRHDSGMQLSTLLSPPLMLRSPLRGLCFRRSVKGSISL